MATRGLSFDFLVLNAIGFACYSVYTTSMCFSGKIRKEYAERFGSTPQVKGNDVVFAWHALLLSSVTLLQVVWIGQTSWRNRVSPRTKVFATILLIACALGATFVSSFKGEWLGYLYFLRYQVNITLAYCCQCSIELNPNLFLQCNQGWDIYNEIHSPSDIELFKKVNQGISGILFAVLYGPSMSTLTFSFPDERFGT